MRDRAGIIASLAELGSSAFVQELVEAPEYTVDLFVDPRDGTPISCVPRERVHVVDGASQIGRTVRDAILRDATLRLASALRLTGHLTVQAFRRGEEVLFIEVNPRYGGGASLGFEAGARDTGIRGPGRPRRVARTAPRRVRVGPPHAPLRRRPVRPRSRPADDRDGEMSRSPGLPSAVLFDLDDTLYPERQFVDGGFRAVARFLAPMTGVQATTLAARVRVLHDRDGRGRLFDTVLAELGLGHDSDLILACVLTYRTHRPRLTPFDGAIDGIDAVRAAGVPVGLVSDGHGAVQRRKLAALSGLTRRLDAVVLTDELGAAYAKPSPVAFRVACLLLEAEPARAVYVGNDPRKDFAGAREAGLRTIRTGRSPDLGGATIAGGGEPNEADLVIDGMTDLVEAVLRSGPIARSREVVSA